MQIIYKQDVIKSEPRNAQGRRALEVRRTKYKDYAETKRNEREAKRIERETQRRDKIPLNNDQLETSKRRRKVLAHEEQILERLLAYEKIPSHIYDETLQLLGAEWDKKRVYGWWNYRINK
ncbi:hypothetical protein RirG_171070 [Rhizophagus irregularis DAOM 197198w]|uniref:Uncharacterized protein n=1 Tax=Rhizophagus irregularis (strain DAOM 197198w) TaxID=1432141 RepID=A0A015J3W5_RHIIW|nr:hypothetical protein RirG_171070 [Rhizophagus irregularis DAOM 197198w]